MIRRFVVDFGAVRIDPTCRDPDALDVRFLWDSTNDHVALGPRTAAVLALGEERLTYFKRCVADGQLLSPGSLAAAALLADAAER